MTVMMAVVFVPMTVLVMLAIVLFVIVALVMAHLASNDARLFFPVKTISLGKPFPPNIRPRHDLAAM